MGLNAVLQHVNGLLQGLPIPGTVPTATVSSVITPPPIEALDGPRAYVWSEGTEGPMTRQSMPRGQGFVTTPWLVDVYLDGLDLADDPTIDQNFPVIIDVIRRALLAATMPLMITDPATGIESQLLEIGERIWPDYPPPRATQKGRTLLYQARIRTLVREAEQA